MPEPEILIIESPKIVLPVLIEEVKIEKIGRKRLIVKEEAIEYMQKYNWNIEEAISIFDCESGFDTYAYNAEKEAKLRGITLWSSCGIAQINSPLCKQTGNVLFDYKVNLDFAYEKYVNNGWLPWKKCAIKNGLL